MEQKMHNFFAIYLSFLTVSSVVKIHVISFKQIAPYSKLKEDTQGRGIATNFTLET